MLTRTWWIVVSVLVVVLGLLQWARPEPTSWKKTFSSSSTQPYGTWIALHVLDSLAQRSLTMVDSASDAAIAHVPRNAQWWIVTRRFEAAVQEVDSLMAFVERGGHLVIATQWMNDSTQRRLGVNIHQPFAWDEGAVLVYDSGRVAQQLPMNDEHMSSHFSARTDTSVPYEEQPRWDSLVSLAMAPNVATDQTTDWLLAGRRAVGKGTIVLLASPELISNIAFLNDTSVAVARLLLPMAARTDVAMVWDRYHNGSLQLPTVGDVLARSHAAQLAVVLVALAGLMYVTTNVRRRQRAIAIREVLTNTTAEFVRTVADLMQSSHDPAYVMRMRVVHLRRYCATVLHVPLVSIDSTTERRLVAATGCDAQLIRDVLDLVRRYGDIDGVEQQWTDAEWSATDLLRRSAIIDTFYEKASR